MILKVNSTNRVGFTLNDISNELFFIIKFVNKLTNKSKNMLLNNNLVNNNFFSIYDIFLVDEIDEELLNQKINLETGQYDYYVYESDLEELDILNKKIIQKGLVRVIGIEEEIDTFDTIQNIKIMKR